MAEKRIKGITIEIGGDTKKLSEALKGVNGTIKNVNDELQDLNKALKLDPKNTELLAQKQELLKDKIKATTERLETLKEAQKQLGEYNSLTEEQKENYRALSVEISKAESSVKNLKNELKETNKFDLKNLNDSLSGIREISTDLVKKFAKIGTAIGGALTALGVASIKSYADYEQLVGGVETLFKESADDIKKYAQNAYKTAGLSANDYMETVTSFSASLIQSLEGDTQKATKYADMAITDMSDNANKMGTNIENLQSAYQAFAKQNFTLLDNLKIGYGGTKTEMQRLIADANKVKEANGEMANLSIERFSDMVEAIHIVQNEMGITGTTAKEADSTILGSVNSMKASWKNLLNAVADNNQDMSKAVDNFINSTITAGKNIVPRIKTAIEGIKKLFNSLVRDVFPKLKREIPELKPLINIFEWFIDHKNLIINAVKLIIGAFVVTKIVDFATKLQKTFNAITNFATGGTLGMITTAVAGLITITTLLGDTLRIESEEQRKARIELEKNAETLTDNLNSWNDLENAKQESLNKSMSEISYYENLYKELQNITDENGRVKEGYEARADFIVTQLKDAYGIEMELIDGQITGYKDIQAEIDKLIEKKRAEAIVSSQTAQYEEARSKKEEAYSNMIYWEEELTREEERYEKARGGQDEEFWKQRLEKVQQAHDNAEDIYNKYNYVITQYEDNLQKFHEEKYDEMSTATWEYTKTLEDASDQQKKIIEDNISRAEYDYNWFKKKYEETGDEMYKVQMDNAKRNLDAEKENLKKYISAITDRQGEATQAGANFMQGVANGISSKSSTLYSYITNVGNTMIARFKSALKEQSPSKATREMGQYLLEGISLGLKDEERGLMNQVDEIGTGIIGGLMNNAEMAMSGLNSSIKTSLNPTINPSIAYDLNYQLMANAMKEALTEVDVVLDDRQVGKFVNKVVSEEVFN